MARRPGGSLWHVGRLNAGHVDNPKRHLTCLPRCCVSSRKRLTANLTIPPIGPLHIPLGLAGASGNALESWATYTIFKSERSGGTTMQFCISDHSSVLHASLPNHSLANMSLLGCPTLPLREHLNEDHFSPSCVYRRRVTNDNNLPQAAWSEPHFPNLCTVLVLLSLRRAGKSRASSHGPVSTSSCSKERRTVVCGVGNPVLILTCCKPCHELMGTGRYQHVGPICVDYY